MAGSKEHSETPKSDSTKSDAAQREERTLTFWRDNEIFKKSLEKPAPKGNFIFYEGPPTANGQPGLHHLESRAFKDALPRYKTMRGYRVPRRAGWDTHGLPVELQIEKELGFTGKKDIEAYGIAAFNKKCRESVFKYVDEWEKFSNRVGYWVDQSKAYFTFDAPYMESVWNILKHVSEEGRLYKDYKVVPWCVRCGTALSSHELAQGYEDVKDLSITAKFELVDEPGTYFLAWTTTPWTLPGNVALAVGETITYGRYTNGTEKVILATARAKEVLDESWKPEEEMPGSALVGKKYKPLYPFAEKLAADEEKKKFENAFTVYGAEFVTTEDGTGIVHSAVMYGQEDFELGTRVGLPKVHLVAPDGHFIQSTEFLEGRFVKDEELAVDIVKDLAARTPNSLLFAKGKHEHSYPFCWRCKTPLIYYARDSWYIRMQDLRDTLVAENEKVHWEPEHTRDGRMGEWLRGAKDWAISRERYWGTPLPVWQSEDAIERIMIGSIEELKTRTKKSGNKYFLMRHGEGEHNVKGILSSNLADDKYGLTATGRAQVQEQAEKLKGSGITHIYASPFRRTRESAEIMADVLGISHDSIVYDETLREIDFGDLDGKPFGEFLEYEEKNMQAYSDSLPNGESYLDAKRRFGGFLYNLEKVHADSIILMISHGMALEALKAVVEGAGDIESKHITDTLEPKPGEMMELDFVPLPRNENYELDLHRPYIDEITLVSDSGKELERVKDVIDVWFDSGAMPFAEDHYPFENKEWVEGPGYPADYISEAIDQTRGWFYTLLAVGVLQGRGHAYKNVICLGHLLDEKGQKMSKSKGNVIAPLEAVDQWGADALRFWMYSVNAPGDSKNFDEKTVKESLRTLSWLENSMRFYQLFVDNDGGPKETNSEEQVIDSWMRIRSAEVVNSTTFYLDNYKLLEATRTIASLFEDLSQWYVRRIRDRAREGDASAISTLRNTLNISARLLAPFAPFLAEEVYRAVKNDIDPESVHLTEWPEEPILSEDDKKLLEGMRQVRAFASEGLMLRQKAGIKVRQPLAKLSIPGTLSKELCVLLAEEVNVKVIEQEASEMQLDIVITDELMEAGDIREFMRALADARKELGLSPRDQVTLTISENATGTLEGTVFPGIAKLSFGGIVDPPHTAELSFGTVSFHISRDAT